MRRVQSERRRGRPSREWVVWLIGALSLGAFLFFTLAPLGEQRLHRAELEAPETTSAQLMENVNILCKNELGTKMLNEALPELPRARRSAIIQHAISLGCVARISPKWRADHALHTPDDALTTADAIAERAHAIEPAIRALESARPIVRQRAERALTALAELMSEDQRQRAAKRLATDDRSEAANALRSALGRKPRHRPSSISGASASHNATNSAPGDTTNNPTNNATNGAPGNTANSAPAVDGAGATTGGGEDVKLGAGELRLKLDPTLPGLSAPALRAPTLRAPARPDGVLYRRGARPADPDRGGQP